MVRIRASRNDRRARASAGLERTPAVGSGAVGSGAVALAAGTAVGAVVVVQEDLLERRLATRQRFNRVLGERGDQRPDAPGDLEAQRVRPGR